MVPIRAVGLKLTGDLVPGKLGIIGFWKTGFLTDLESFDELSVIY